MQKSLSRFLWIGGILLISASLAHSQQYVIVDSENGDRLTGIWRGANDTEFEIDYHGQVLRFPLTGRTFRFTSNLEHVADRTAVKHFRNGLDLLELNSPELAKRRFEAALEEFPKYADAHYQLGLLHQEAGETEAALARFRSVAKIDAVNFELVPLLRNIGDTALAAENYTTAVDAYQLILNYYPEHESVRTLSYHTGFLLVEQLRDAVTGLAMLEGAIKQFPDAPFHEKALFHIGKLQAETAQLDNAHHTLSGFVQRYSESEWVYEARLALAIVNLRMGRKQDAATEANLVRTLSTDTALTERAEEILAESAWNVYTEAEGLPHNTIQAIAMNGTYLWIGTPKGVMFVETYLDSWMPIPAVANLINTHFETVPDVQTIAVHGPEVWIGTRNQGALYYNQETNEINRYAPPDALPSAWVRDIQLDNTEIWFATDAGVVRQPRATGERLVYNTQNSFIPSDDVHTLALTDTTLWVASRDGTIATFARQLQEWQSYHSTETEEGTAIAKFDVAAEQLLFTWFNANYQANGYFQAEWNGDNGQSTTLLTGIEEPADLAAIYIAGVIDTSPPEEVPAPETSPVGEPSASQLTPVGENSASQQSPIGEDGFLENDEALGTPLVLWIATNEDVFVYYTRSATDSGWKTIRTPRTLIGESTAQCIAVANDRTWIGTSNGLATISAQTLNKRESQ